MNAAEKKIADFLDEVGIKYIYENPQLIEQEYQSGGKTKKFLRIFYPDFFLSEFGVILEFWGMHEKDEYAKVMEKKKEDYYFNWIFVVNVYNLEGKWKEYILKKLRDVSEHRLKVANRALDKYDAWPAEKKKGDTEYYEKRRQMQKAQGITPSPQRSHHRPGQKPPHRPGQRPGQRPLQRQGQRPQQRSGQRPRPSNRPHHRPRPQQTAPVLKKAVPVVAKPVAVKPVAEKKAVKKKVVKKAVKKTVKKVTKKKVVKKAVKKKSVEKKGLLNKLFKKD